MRTFALVTVTLCAEQMAVPAEEAVLDGVWTITDLAEDVEDGCEGGQHNLGNVFLTTIDGSDCVIRTCLACTAAEVASGTIVSIVAREDREPVT